MKRFQKTIAFLLSIALIMGLAVSAYAAAGTNKDPNTPPDLTAIADEIGQVSGVMQSLVPADDAIAATEASGSTTDAFDSLTAASAAGLLDQAVIRSASDQLTWAQVRRTYPFLPVETVNWTYSMKDLPWIVVYLIAPQVYDDLVCIGFRQDGTAIDAEASVHAPIQEGQHMAAFIDGICIGLADVGTFEAPTDSDLNPPTINASWDTVCSQLPNHPVQVLDFDVDPYREFLGYPWIALNFLFYLTQDKILVPFDSAGHAINLESQKTALVQKGQHYVLIDSDEGEIEGLYTIGPVSAPGTGFTIADLVIVAKALNGQLQLTDAQREKYGISGAVPTISDLVRLARRLNG
ncbi:MAG: hypothetical protein HDQ87_10275 [Clostridia bacterium]|nr:hypothetical protein [Clostridia bacterium]